MTVEKMREQLALVYNNGPGWRLRCQTMPDRQIIAIYKNMDRRGKFDSKPKRKKFKVPDYSEPKCIQLTIWDFMR